MLEKELTKSVYNELLKYDLVDDIEKKLLRKDNLICLDINDIKTVAKSSLYAYYKGQMKNLNLNIVNNEITASKGIIYFDVSPTITLKDIEDVIEKVKDNKEINLILGLNNNLDNDNYLFVILY